MVLWVFKARGIGSGGDLRELPDAIPAFRLRKENAHFCSGCRSRLICTGHALPSVLLFRSSAGESSSVLVEGNRSLLPGCERMDTL